MIIKRTLLLILALSLIGLASPKGALADEVMTDTLRGATYGGAIGALIGGAVMVLSDDPSNNLSYIATGAAVGVLGGAAYSLSQGVVYSSSAAEYEDGRWAFNMPTFEAFGVRDIKTNVTEYIGRVNFFKARF